jgi:hypothetical protein
MVSTKLNKVQGNIRLENKNKNKKPTKDEILTLQ